MASVSERGTASAKAADSFLDQRAEALPAVVLPKDVIDRA